MDREVQSRGQSEAPAQSLAGVLDQYQRAATARQAWQYLSALPMSAPGHTVERGRSVLEALGRPDKGPVIIHVAGTNGKGSVCAMLRLFLERYGLSVGLFTSPHLADVRERICLGGERISPEDFVQSFVRVARCVTEMEAPYLPGQFEYLFFMAAEYFGRRRPDVWILETGLGGRLDATNAIESPALCIITSIGLDHEAYLGHSPEAIAGEKAGILKPGAALAAGVMAPEARRVLEARAEELGLEAWFLEEGQWDWQGLPFAFSFQSLYDKYENLPLPGRAPYQGKNAGLAISAMEWLLGRVPAPAPLVREVMGAVSWPCRMQELAPGLWADGAHNPQAMEAFLEAAAWEAGEKILILAMMEDKDCASMLAMVRDSGLFERVYMTGLPMERALDRMGAEGLLSSLGLELGRGGWLWAEDAEEALERAQAVAGAKIFAAGSLYLAGQLWGRGRHQEDAYGF